jgi:ATP-dependent exoDNAse (exonuclease V) alpha subunit
MLAARRDDVDDLNTRARLLMRESGRLGKTELVVAGRSFSIGDRVMTTRNARRWLGVLNGTQGEVAAIDTKRGELTLRTDGSRKVTLPASYLSAGHLTHAYAMTGHKAQGMTTARCFALGDDTLYKEWGYTALSRGKKENRPLSRRGPRRRPRGSRRCRLLRGRRKCASHSSLSPKQE